RKDLKPIKSLLIIAFLALGSQVGFSQLIQPPVGMEFRLKSKFNPEFIRKNRIAEIRCKVESKKDGDKIRNTNREEVYHFYENGNLKMISHINNRLRDTSITFFEYTQGRLECEVKNDAAGMFSYCY